MKTNKNVVIGVVIAALIFGGAGFFAGTKYQQTRRFQGNGNFAQGGQRAVGANGTRPGGQGSPAQGFRPTAGEIIAADDKSITVKMDDGSSKIIFVNDQSTVTEATSSGKQSLTVGKKVMVFGSANQDGSVTAQNIQLNPQGGMMFRGTPPQNK